MFSSCNWKGAFGFQELIKTPCHHQPIFVWKVHNWWKVFQKQTIFLQYISEFYISNGVKRVSEAYFLIVKRSRFYISCKRQLFFFFKLQFSFFSFLLKNGGSLYSIKFKQTFLSLDRYALFNANMLIIFTFYFKQKNSNFFFIYTLKFPSA